jgi:predicted transposase YbfD/YdcC
LDKGHGRIEARDLWCQPISPAPLGLAGAAQIIRIHRKSQTLRRGQVIHQTNEVAFALTTLWAQEANPDRLLDLVRSHWTIENGQHYRRDRTQDEDRCTVRHPTAARNLSLFRSLSIFLLELQRPHPHAKKSLPDFQRHNHRRPGTLIHRFMSG